MRLFRISHAVLLTLLLAVWAPAMAFATADGRIEIRERSWSSSSAFFAETNRVTARRLGGARESVHG